MQKNKVFSTLCLVSGLLLAPAAYAERTPNNAITDSAKLHEITDDYRSAPSRPNDFSPQGDGTAIDKRTGLQWMRCSLGQKWIGKTCSGEPNRYNLQDALNQSPEFAGYADWRLPSLAELETLVYCRSGRDEGRSGALIACKGENLPPTIARQTFPRTSDGFYWSSSPYAGSYEGAWGVYFNYGSDYYYSKLYRHYVRLVRGGL